MTDACAGLGLHYGRVELAGYDPGWAAAYRREEHRLRVALEGCRCRVEHVGSTAVPGLVAKPILDVAVRVEEIGPLQTCFPALERLGYQYRGDAGAEGGHVFVRESSPLVRTHHLHLVARDDPQWEAWLALRDHLRSSPSACATYAAAKRRLARRFAGDRRSYTRAKDEVVALLLAEARADR